MIIGVPMETKKEEYRVGIVPAGAADLRKEGHTILVEPGAGKGSGYSDEEYLSAGADIADKATLFKKADIIIKVKEPLPDEYPLFKEGQALFTFLHLASNRSLTELLLTKKITALAYETLMKNESLPLLSPMSEIAGRMAPLVGAHYLQKVHGGSGILPTGATLVDPARILILGAGVVGTNAAIVSKGIGMDIVVMNRSAGRLKWIHERFSGRVRTAALTPANIKKEIKEADIIIGAVLVPGGKTPMLISKVLLSTMKKGSVIVDVSVDQGGCAETSRPTTHDNPVYSVEGIVHYAVANMPGAYPRTSTIALTNATLPFIKTIANMGIVNAFDENETIKTALNTYQGQITNETLSKTFGNQG